MRILNVSVSNFMSYKALALDLTDRGLTGVFGTTGAGKSTLMDVIPYGLYGIIGKDTSADDIKSWHSQDEVTEVHVMVDTPTGVVGVLRTRARGKNDLYWIEYGPANGHQHPGEPIRGKDLKDTQKLLEARLGVSADLFLLSGYMSQFSEADSFFIASAKDRRQVLEKIADQEFAIRLGEKTAEARKVAKKDLEALELKQAKLTGGLDTLKSALSRTKAQATAWDQNNILRIQQLTDKVSSYRAVIKDKAAAWDVANVTSLDSLHARIEAHEYSWPSSYFDDKIAELKEKSRCTTCGSLPDHLSEAIAHLREQKLHNAQEDKKLQELVAQYQAEGAKENPHRVQEENPYEIQLRDLKDEPNPYTPNLDVYSGEIRETETALKGTLTQITSLQERISSLTWLYDKSFELRALMMDRVVRQVEEKANYYLEKFFDGALRVQLSCTDSDKIDVVILNDGHEASFRCLSGGERTMLKLAFTLSVMRAAQNKAGVSLNVLMLDEPLNGLPDDLKVKAFGLFEELTDEFETVLVIDHSEAFKSCFQSTLNIDKVNGLSVCSKGD